MPQKIIKASNFERRQDLEDHVMNKVGLTPQLKEDYIIKGKREDLKKLDLSDRTIFWGIRCEIADTPTKPKKNLVKPERGKKAKTFGIEGSEKSKKVKK
jgi:hypothetical protein|tara:strand:+ start:974 stop:1270 length:297 start_codon:yes stop_codon:yes gene_type:complete